jgi:hypothetical protein
MAVLTDIRRKIFRWLRLLLILPLWPLMKSYNHLPRNGRLARTIRWSIILLFLPILLPIYVAWRKEKVTRWLMLIGVIWPKTPQDIIDRSLVHLAIGNYIGSTSIARTASLFLLHKLGIKSMTAYLGEHAKQIVAEMGDQFFLRAAKMDDRSMAVICTSLLERYMGLAIMSRFGLVKDEKQFEKAFGPNGPFAGMSSKITMCAVLGILVGDMAHDLNLLRKVRNKFAHELKEISFVDKDPPIASWCNTLKLRGALSDEIKTAAGSEQRIRFLESTQALTVYLNVLLLRNAYANLELTKLNDVIHRQVKETMHQAKAAPAT